MNLAKNYALNYNPIDLVENIFSAHGSVYAFFTVFLDMYRRMWYN